MIFFAHGDKGGVGKSVAASVLVEALLTRGRSVTIVESDLKIPDVARRFASVPGVRVIAANLNRAGDEINAVAGFAEQIETVGIDRDIVVNLPAGAGDTLDRDASLLVGALREIGHPVRVLYSLGPSAEQADSLIHSLESGLCGAVDPTDILILLAGWQADQAGFAWVTNPARAIVLESGVCEHLVPRIQPDPVLAKFAAFEGRLAAFEASLPIFSRAYFHRWLNRFVAAVGQIMPPATVEIAAIETAKSRARG